MTNREYLIKKIQNMSDEELAGVLDVRDIICQNTYTYSDCVNNRKDCKNCVLNWLQQEHKEKITLSETERTILENIDKEYCYIARDSDKELRTFKSKPSKDNVNFWIEKNNDFARLSLFNHLFQFITWNDSEPYNITELLKGE
jgi:hypothetical protein